MSSSPFDSIAFSCVCVPCRRKLISRADLWPNPNEDWGTETSRHFSCCKMAVNRARWVLPGSAHFGSVVKRGCSASGLPVTHRPPTRTGKARWGWEGGNMGWGLLGQGGCGRGGFWWQWGRTDSIPLFSNRPAPFTLYPPIAMWDGGFGSLGHFIKIAITHTQNNCRVNNSTLDK